MYPLLNHSGFSCFSNQLNIEAGRKTFGSCTPRSCSDLHRCLTIETQTVNFFELILEKDRLQFLDEQRVFDDMTLVILKQH